MKQQTRDVDSEIKIDTITCSMKNLNQERKKENPAEERKSNSIKI